MNDAATFLRRGNDTEDGHLKSHASNQGVDTNSSYRQSTSTSYCSSMSSECDLSFSLSGDHEVDALVSRIDTDELPAFEVRLISPLGRSPSPIDNEATTPIADDKTHTKYIEKISPSCRENNPNYVTLQDINDQINPPSDSSHTNNLETIFEGVFLSTPPRQRFILHHFSHSRTNIAEKTVVLNRIQAGKENYSPVRCKTTSEHTVRSIVEK